MKNVITSVKTSVSNSVQELKRFDWSDLGDIETIGIWPGPVKLILGLAIFVSCLGAGYWFHIKNLQETLATVTAEEDVLRNDLQSKAILAANLESYRQQMADMEESFGALLSQLPGQTEVPGLLEDITFTGLGSGLEFSSIQLQNEVAQEYYVELPIMIQVNGGYHDFGAFVSGVASLSRIVTLHDFNIASGASDNELEMTITARTYRYNSGDE
ncbi:MAG: type 4a pilus biogenesis protein PilO [Pseudohongiellaceae bacterium]